jgi:hypothetical protein
MSRRAVLRGALALYAGQVLASAVVVLFTPSASRGGFTEFRLYFAVGDWLSVRLPLVGALTATLVAAWYLNWLPETQGANRNVRLGAAAASLRAFSIATGIALGTLTVGLVVWMVVLHLESTDRFFSSYAEWPLAGFAFALNVAAWVGLGSVVFAFRQDDPLRAGYFAFCFGYLGLFSVLSAGSFDVVGDTYGWAAVAALAAAVLTIHGTSQRLTASLAIGAALIISALFLPLAFVGWSVVGGVFGLVVIAAMTLGAMTAPLTKTSAPLRAHGAKQLVQPPWEDDDERGSPRRGS